MTDTYNTAPPEEMLQPTGVAKTVKNPDGVSKAFIFFHATSLNGGAMLLGATIASYFAVFMTDTMLIPAASASMIMLIASIWDAINDPIAGSIADRTRTRWGRYRPYFTIFPVLYAICGVLLFSNPTWMSMTMKIYFVGGVYICWGMLYTILTMPQMAILPAVTQDNQTRNKIITIGAAVTAIAFTIASVFTTKLTAFFGGYSPLMAIYGAITILTFWGLFVSSKGKEQYVEEVKPEDQRSVFKDIFYLFKFKEIYSVILVWCLASMSFGLMFGSSVFYVLYYLARPDLIPLYMGIVSIGALLSMAVFMPFCLKIFKTGHKTLIYTQIITLTAYAVCFVFGKNLSILYVFTFIATCFGAMSNALVNVLVNDTIDFVQLKDGISLNGTIAAIKGFAQKCGTTVVNSGILAVLAATGYIAGAVGHQNDATLFGLNMIRFGAPALISLVVVVCMIYYPIAKYFPAIEKMKAEKRESSS